MSERVVLHPVEGGTIPRAFAAIEGIDLVAPDDSDGVAAALTDAPILDTDTPAARMAMSSRFAVSTPRPSRLPTTEAIGNRLNARSGVVSSTNSTECA